MEAITNEEDMARAIEDALFEADDNAAGEDGERVIRRVSSFADAGVLTADTGLVVRLHDGSEYQITIVRSK
jgi:hypothetical protein